jgi:hypothetical protein
MQTQGWECPRCHRCNKQPLTLKKETVGEVRTVLPPPPTQYYDERMLQER